MSNEDKNKGILFFCITEDDEANAISQGEVWGLPYAVTFLKAMDDDFVLPFQDTLVLSPGATIMRDPSPLFRNKRYKDSGYLKWGTPELGALVVCASLELGQLADLEANMPEVTNGEYTNCSGSVLFKIEPREESQEEPSVEPQEELQEEPQEESQEESQEEPQEEIQEEPRYKSEDIRKIAELDLSDGISSRDVLIKLSSRRRHAEMLPNGEFSYHGHVGGPVKGWRANARGFHMLDGHGGLIGTVEEVETGRYVGRTIKGNKRLTMVVL